MSSPVASIGLTYDGLDLQTSDLQLFLEIVKGLNEPPTVRGTDTIVPALAGRAEGLRVNDVLPIELYGIVQPDPVFTLEADIKASFRANALAVRELFATDRARALLVATLEDGLTQQIYARPLNAVWNVVVQSYIAYVSIALEGYDDWEPVGS